MHVRPPQYAAGYGVGGSGLLPMGFHMKPMRETKRRKGEKQVMQTNKEADMHCGPSLSRSDEVPLKKQEGKQMTRSK